MKDSTIYATFIYKMIGPILRNKGLSRTEEEYLCVLKTINLDTFNNLMSKYDGEKFTAEELNETCTSGVIMQSRYKKIILALHQSVCLCS